jgi:hypothetical protein
MLFCLAFVFNYYSLSLVAIPQNNFFLVPIQMKNWHKKSVVNTEAQILLTNYSFDLAYLNFDEIALENA